MVRAAATAVVHTTFCRHFQPASSCARAPGGALGRKPELLHLAAPAPTQQPQQAYYTPYEVATHNTPSDAWVSLLGRVVDVTRLLRDHPGLLTAPILAAAGSDVSHWFDAATGDVRTRVDPDTQLVAPYCPQGLFLHVPQLAPTTAVDCSADLVPWWRDPALQVGRLSAATRLVRVRNVLTEQEDTLEVPSEETVGQLRQRYLALNAHAGSYALRALVRARAGGGAAALEWVELRAGQTLQEQGVADEAAAFEAADLPPDHHVPVLHACWLDDLTAT